MEFIRKEKKFSLYINGVAADVPQKPTWDGDLIRYNDNMDIQIGKTVPGKELTWQVFRDHNRVIRLCDRNLVNWISREDCDQLIQNVTVEDQEFHQYLPDAGFGDDNSFKLSDWLRMVNQLKDPEEELHTDGCYSHIFGRASNGMSCLVGYESARSWSKHVLDFRFNNYAWRPILISFNDDQDDVHKVYALSEMGKAAVIQKGSEIISNIKNVEAVHFYFGDVPNMVVDLNDEANHAHETYVL